jgi:hypothetical protein
VRRVPLTIKLLYGSSGYRQTVLTGMDTGSKTIGAAVIGNGKVLYQAEVQLRQDVSAKLKQRDRFRRTRRSRKTRYRPARFNNRAASRAEGRLAPSIRSRVESHLRGKRVVESILPVSHWKAELAEFDIHKISNPEVAGKDYQYGEQKGYYNKKSYVLHRDGYKCQSNQQKVQHSRKLNVHHIVFLENGGTDAPSNLITLCETCHEDMHRGKFEIKGQTSKTKYPTETGVIKSILARIWDFQPTFGYETKFKREQCLKRPKTHAADAVAVCCEDGQLVEPESYVYFKRHVTKGDYRQTNGSRSEKRIPTGKLFGFRKFDLIKTSAGIGFVKGKRASGWFSIANLNGIVINPSVSIRGAIRISARSTTLTERRHSSDPLSE